MSTTLTLQFCVRTICEIMGLLVASALTARMASESPCGIMRAIGFLAFACCWGALALVFLA